MKKCIIDFKKELLRFIAVALKRYYYFICHPEEVKDLLF